MRAKSLRLVLGMLRKALLLYNYPYSDLLFIADHLGRNFYSAHTRHVQPKNAGSTAVQNLVRLFYRSESATINVASHHCCSHMYCASTSHTYCVDINYFAVVRDGEAALIPTACIRVGSKDLYATVPAREGYTTCFPRGRNPDINGKGMKGWAVTQDVGLHERENDFVVSRCIESTIGIRFSDECS